MQIGQLELAIPQTEHRLGLGLGCQQAQFVIPTQHCVVVEVQLPFRLGIRVEQALEHGPHHCDDEHYDDQHRGGDAHRAPEPGLLVDGHVGHGFQLGAVERNGDHLQGVSPGHVKAEAAAEQTAQGIELGLAAGFPGDGSVGAGSGLVIHRHRHRHAANAALLAPDVADRGVQFEVAGRLLAGAAGRAGSPFSAGGLLGNAGGGGRLIGERARHAAIAAIGAVLFHRHLGAHRRQVRIVGLAGLLLLGEVEGEIHLRRIVVSPKDRDQDGVNFLFVFELLLLLHRKLLASLGRERVLGAGVEQAAVLIGHSDAGRLQAVHGGGDHVDDGVHLSLTQRSPFQAQHDCGARLAFVAGEHVVLGDGQQHLGLGDVLELLDGARQLALAAQFQTLALHALADPEAGVLEQYGFPIVAGLAAAGEAGAGQAQPDVRIILGADQHALAIDLIGDLLLIQVIQGGDQLLGVEGAEGTHLRLLAPQQDEDGDGQTDGQPQDQGDLPQHIGVGQEAQGRALLLVLIEGCSPLVVHQQIAVWIVSHSSGPYC
ncbi:hypothetical protein D3C87_1086530 [compost metagenome]